MNDRQKLTFARIYSALCGVVSEMGAEFFEHHATKDDRVKMAQAKKDGTKYNKVGSARFMMEQIERFNVTDPNEAESVLEFEKCGYDYNWFREVMCLAGKFLSLKCPKQPTSTQGKEAA